MWVPNLAPRAERRLLMPTRTPIADVVTAYVNHIRTVKTPKSAQTDIYYLRDAFGPICSALEITSRKPSLATKKPPQRTDRTAAGARW